MLWADRSLVRAQQPAFDQGSNSMNAWHADVGRIAGVREKNLVMFVAATRQRVVTAPSISQNIRAFFGDVANERYKALAGDIGYPTHSCSPEPLRRTDFHCDGHYLLLFATASTFASHISAPDVGFVHFKPLFRVVVRLPMPSGRAPTDCVSARSRQPKVLDERIFFFSEGCRWTPAWCPLSIQRHLGQYPKFYFFDAGVYRSVRPRGPLDAPEEMAGAALEGLVAQHLRAWIAYGNRPDIKLYHWRTKTGTEVDFVLYGEETLFALEVKNARNVYRNDVRALRTFLEDYPQAQACLLYRGRERLTINGILCLPCAEFLQALRPGENLPS